MAMRRGRGRTLGHPGGAQHWLQRAGSRGRGGRRPHSVRPCHGFERASLWESRSTGATGPSCADSWSFLECLGTHLSCGGALQTKSFHRTQIRLHRRPSPYTPRLQGSGVCLLPRGEAPRRRGCGGGLGGAQGPAEALGARGRWGARTAAGHLRAHTLLFMRPSWACQSGRRPRGLTPARL